MSDKIYDAIVIGGGPGGSAAATYLALSGRRVVALEKEFFPRFHIGESLLPYNQRLFREMGVAEKIQKAGFIQKAGAQFHSSNGHRSAYFVFREGRFTRETQALQVERSVFDDLLLKHAAERGAEVREGWSVERFSYSKGLARVHASDPDGKSHIVRGQFLIDASGRGNVTGNQERLRVVHPRLKKIAIFGHFEGVRLDAGESAGDTVIVRFENKWFWLIPLAGGKVSVGCVVDREEVMRSGETPAEIFFRLAQSSPALRERMTDARLIAKLQTTGDFSYRNRRLVGERLLRVGDAAGFMDPIFSAGVYLAMYSGRMAARCVDQSLRARDDGRHRLRVYEKRLTNGMKFYWKMVEQFYTTPFMEVFFSPKERFQLASAVNAALAGELEGGWLLRARLRLFFLVVRAQSRWPVTPRIASFE